MKNIELEISIQAGIVARSYRRLAGLAQSIKIEGRTDRRHAKIIEHYRKLFIAENKAELERDVLSKMIYDLIWLD